MKKVLLAVVVLVIIAVVAFAVRTLGARDETDAVDAKDASGIVQKGDDTKAADAVDPGLRPEAGTYTYTGSGRDSVSALGGSQHVYPGTIPTVVTLDPKDDCRWTSNVIYVKQHVEERKFCTDSAGMTDKGFIRNIEFFNQTQKTDYACGEGATRLVLDAAPGDTATWECTEGIKATSKYTGTFVGKQTIKVGDADVDTWHVKVVSVQSGDTVGGDTSEFWYAKTGLAVKFTGNLSVQTKSVLGDTKYQERFTYQLTSMDPKSGDDTA